MGTSAVTSKRRYLILHCDATLNFVNTFKGESQDLDVDILLVEKAIQEYKNEIINGKKDKAHKKQKALALLFARFNEKLNLLMKD